MPRTAPLLLALLLFGLVSLLKAQGTPPATPLTLVTSQGRRPVPTVVVNAQEFVALDDIATLFQVAAREDSLAGGITVTYKGRTVVISSDQAMASLNGRLVSLPAAAIRSGRRWFVPIEFLPRALAPIYDARIELRRPSRLLIVGDLRIPRVTVRLDQPGPPTRQTVEISPPAAVTVSYEPARLLVRVEADALDFVGPGAPGGLIEQIRIGDQPTTIAIGLSARAGTARVVTTTAENVTRVAIDVPLSAAPSETSAAQAPPATAAGPTPIDLGASAAANAKVLDTIVLDPGHGGDDTGVRGRGGALEKQIAIDVARRLRALIEMRLGVRVVLTRDDDQAITLDQRAAIANNNKAGLFLSLHVNASPSPTVTGASVYTLRLDRDGQAERASAAAGAVALPVLGGGTRTLDVVRWDLAQTRHVDASAMLATVLAEELRKRVPMATAPLQQFPLRVLSGVDMPAALVELACLTNAEQEAAAQSADFQALLAQGLYDAIVRFRGYVEDGRNP